jgi:hypothetical protein
MQNLKPLLYTLIASRVPGLGTRCRIWDHGRFKWQATHKVPGFGESVVSNARIS